MILITKTSMYVCIMYVFMYVYKYRQHFQKSMDQPGTVAILARGQLKRDHDFPLVPVRA